MKKQIITGLFALLMTVSAISAAGTPLSALDSESGINDVSAENSDKAKVEYDDPSMIDFLPDTVSSFDTIIEEYGNITIAGKYIVVCATEDPAAGYSIQVNISGDAKYIKKDEYSIKESYPDGTGAAGAPLRTVIVYEILSDGDFNIELCECKNPEGTYYFLAERNITYSNNISETTVHLDGIDHSLETNNKTEVDYDDPYILNLLPDTITEYEWFIEKNGNIAVNGKYVVTCATEDPISGYSMHESISGDAKYIKRDEFLIKPGFPNGMEPTDVPRRTVTVYEILSDGDFNIELYKGKGLEGTYYFHAEKKYRFSNNVSVVEETESLYDTLEKDWTIEQAVDFRNHYGTVRIIDDKVCLLIRQDDETKTVTSDIEPCFTQNITSDNESNELFNMLDSGKNLRFYRVVYKPDKDFSISVKSEKTGETVKYEFTTSQNKIIRTDRYANIPDSPGEFEEYLKSYGEVSEFRTNDGENFIVFCSRVPGPAGYSLIEEHSGNVEFDRIEVKNLNMMYYGDSLVGGPQNTMILYFPKNSGTLKMTWKIARPWQIDETVIFSQRWKFRVEEGDRIVHYYLGSDHVNDITDVPSGDDIDDALYGDINNDGSINAADAVALSRWLLGAEDANISEFSDISGDGKIDIVDLIVLKNKLLGS